MTLMTSDCGAPCREEAEFSVKFILTSLKFDNPDVCLAEVLIVVTFDGNVFKFEDLEKNEDGELKFVGQEIVLQLTPERFSEKLHQCPVMFDLCIGCDELGTFKLNISECFADAVKCDEFASQTSTGSRKFLNEDEEEVAAMDLIFQVTRTNDEATQKLNKMMRKNFEEKKRKLRAKEMDNLSSSFDDDSQMSLSCDDTDLCPIDEDSELPSTSCPFSSSIKSKSTRSKCCSDIAASLDILDFEEDQKTTCKGCGGVSISGITCENKNLLCDDDVDVKTSNSCQKLQMLQKCPSKQSISPQSCQSTKPRICPECFEDLSVIPNKASCPKCTERSRFQPKLVDMRSECTKNEMTQDIRDHIKSVFEEIFFETKNQLLGDWKRLSKKKTGCKKDCEGIIRRESKSLPRNSKVFASSNKSRKTKSQGLRKKNHSVILGHKWCQTAGNLVPKNMGWLWTAKIIGLPAKMRRGWRPGSVRNPVAKIMKQFLYMPTEPLSPICEPEPPTLRIEKRNGEYLIVMNPLRDEMESSETSPIVFKITKTEDEKARSKARKILKALGIKKACDCRTVEECQCFTKCEKIRVKNEVSKISKELCLNPELTLCDLSATSEIESELDVEFTPPSAAYLRNPHPKDVKVSYASTQYERMKNCGVVCEDDDDDDGKTKKKNSQDDDEANDELSKILNRKKPRKQVVKMLRELPTKSCCNPCTRNNFPCNNNFDHRFTTNYNPMYAQCTVPQIMSTRCQRQPFYY